MKIHIWDDKKLFMIHKELQQLIDDKSVNSVISLTFTHTHNEKYSAILIYK